MTGKEFAKLVCKEGNFKHFPDDGSQFPYVGKIEEEDTISDILKKIYDRGIEYGIRYGKIQKVNEIKKVLNISDED